MLDMRISRASCSTTAGHRLPDVYFTPSHTGGSNRALDIVPGEFNPGVADRIKVFEDLIRASNGNGGLQSQPVVRQQRSRSCPARSGKAPSSPSVNKQIDSPAAGQRLGSVLSLFSGCSTSSGYTSTSPPSPCDADDSKHGFTLSPSRSPPVSHRGGVRADEDEEKRNERDAFTCEAEGLLFSTASTDEDDDVRWSDLESEIVHEQRRASKVEIRLFVCR